MGWVFLLLAFCAVVLALRFGDHEARTVIVALLISYIGTYLSFKFMGDGSWLSTNWGITISDAVAFLILLRLSLKTCRWWPLAVTGLQVLPIFTPVIIATGANIVSDGMGRAQGIWSYPQLVIVILVSIAHHNIFRRRSYLAT